LETASIAKVQRVRGAGALVGLEFGNSGRVRPCSSQFGVDPFGSGQAGLGHSARITAMSRRASSSVADVDLWVLSGRCDRTPRQPPWRAFDGPWRARGGLDTDG